MYKELEQERKKTEGKKNGKGCCVAFHTSHLSWQIHPVAKQGSQSGMSDALAGDVSLDLSLVDPIDTDPNECPSDGYSPKRVSP